MFGDPLVGFFFTAVFEMFPQNLIDIQFQSITGLKATIETEAIAEGGQNMFKHQLPVRTAYENLVLKRGLTTDLSGISEWCKDALENFNFKPVNVNIMLHNEFLIPVKVWRVINAIPVAYEVSEFNAEESKMVIQTMTLKYNYFKEIIVSV